MIYNNMNITTVYLTDSIDSISNLYTKEDDITVCLDNFKEKYDNIKSLLIQSCSFQIHSESGYYGFGYLGTYDINVLEIYVDKYYSSSIQLLDKIEIVDVSLINNSILNNVQHYCFFKDKYEEFIEKVEKICMSGEQYISGTELLDSGKRENFDTGAVRDDDSSKGDEYLLPFDVVGHLLNRAKLIAWHDSYKDPEKMFEELENYKVTGDQSHLYTMLLFAAATFYNCDVEKMIMEVAIHYKQGAKKYEPRNWEKGMPVSRFISSAIRHYLKAVRGDKDEPHERAFVWNIMGAIHIVKIKPSLEDFVLTKDQLNNFGFTVNWESDRNSSGTIGEELDK